MPVPNVNKAAHSGFEPRGDRYHQKSKTGVSVYPKRTQVLQKILKKSFSQSEQIIFSQHFLFTNKGTGENPEEGRLFVGWFCVWFGWLGAGFQIEYIFYTE